MAYTGDPGCAVRDAGGHVESGLYRGGAGDWSSTVRRRRRDGPAEQSPRVPRHAAGSAAGAVQACRRVLQHHHQPAALLPQVIRPAPGRPHAGGVGEPDRHVPLSAGQQGPRRRSAQHPRTTAGRHGPATSRMSGGPSS